MNKQLTKTVIACTFTALLVSSPSWANEIYRVVGNSMYPTLKDGDHIQTTQETPQEGDIVVAETENGTSIVKRLNGNILKGDNEPYSKDFTLDKVTNLKKTTLTNQAPPNSPTAFAATDIFINDLKYIPQATKNWSHDYNKIEAAASLGSGKAIIAGSGGKYQIINSDGSLSTSGTWGPGSSHPIYAVASLGSDKAIMAGSGGKYQIINSDGSLSTSGTWGQGAYTIYAAASLGSGKAIIAGYGGKYQIINSDGSLSPSDTWRPGSSHPIYAAASLGSGKAIIVGSEGKYQIINSDGSLSTPGDWSHGNSSSHYIEVAASLGSGKAIIVGSEGKYQIINSDGSLSEHGTGKIQIPYESVAYLGNNKFIGVTGKDTVFTLGVLEPDIPPTLPIVSMPTGQSPTGYIKVTDFYGTVSSDVWGRKSSSEGIDYIRVKYYTPPTTVGDLIIR